MRSDLGRHALRIVARIERVTSFGAPLTVSVVVPRDAQLVSGQTAFAIPAGMPAGVEERVYVLRFDATPQEDLQLIADIQTPSFGAHARDVYRFGRKAPEVAAPAHNGPEVRMGGVPLGRAVMLPAPAKR